MTIRTKPLKNEDIEYAQNSYFWTMSRSIAPGQAPRVHRVNLKGQKAHFVYLLQIVIKQSTSLKWGRVRMVPSRKLWGRCWGPGWTLWVLPLVENHQLCVPRPLSRAPSWRSQSPWHRLPPLPLPPSPQIAPDCPVRSCGFRPLRRHRLRSDCRSFACHRRPIAPRRRPPGSSWTPI